MITLRETVAAMPSADRLEYALACWEMLTGQDAPLYDVGGVHLTRQQAAIFAVLNRRIGRPVSIDTIMAVMDASKGDATANPYMVRTHISHLRRKLRGKYRITVRYSEGYILVADA